MGIEIRREPETAECFDVITFQRDVLQRVVCAVRDDYQWVASWPLIKPDAMRQVELPGLFPGAAKSVLPVAVSIVAVDPPGPITRILD